MRNRGYKVPGSKLRTRGAEIGHNRRARRQIQARARRAYGPFLPGHYTRLDRALLRLTRGIGARRVKAAETRAAAQRAPAGAWENRMQGVWQAFADQYAAENNAY